MDTIDGCEVRNMWINKSNILTIWPSCNTCIELWNDINLGLNFKIECILVNWKRLKECVSCLINSAGCALALVRQIRKPCFGCRSSYSCSYFVLPCCFWDFNAKFSFDRKSSQGGDDGGKYRLYLDYIQHVGKMCGFNVEEDILRIPSTKRVWSAVTVLSFIHKIFNFALWQ